MKTKLAAVVAFACMASPAFALECNAGLRAFTHSAGETCIPEDPQRIVSLHDGILTTILYELGAPVVGSSGSVRWGDGEHMPGGTEPYLRGIYELFNVSFAETGITNLGDPHTPDQEIIAALESDLIISWDGVDPVLDARLALVAPVIKIENDDPDTDGARMIADAVGRLDEWAVAKAKYDQTIAALKVSWPEAQNSTYASMAAWETTIEAVGAFGSVATVLNDLGLTPNPLTADLQDRGTAFAEISVEKITLFEADYLLTFYEMTGAQRPSATTDVISDILPQWCDQLTSCREDQIIAAAWEHAYGYAFAQKEALARSLAAQGSKPDL